MLTHKYCKRCDTEKPVNLFGVIKNQGTYRAYCLECENRLAKQWCANNPEKYHERNVKNSKAYYEENKDAINLNRKSPEFREADRLYQKEYTKKNIDVVRLKARERSRKNKDKINAQASVHRLANPDRYKPYRIVYYAKNKESILAKSKLFRANNAEKISESKKLKHLSNRNNPLYKLEKALRGSVTSALKRGGYTKKSSTSQLLGLDYPTFKKHIERQFTEGMGWDNYGNKGWHLDHRLPLAFAKTESELILLFHYTNLQPLWARENLSKGAKIIEHQLKIAI